MIRQVLTEKSHVENNRCYVVESEKAIAALRNLVIETHHMYSSVNIFLNRSRAKAYNPKGRNQTEEEAIALDKKIFETVNPIAPLTQIDFSRDASWLIADRVQAI